MEKYGNCKVNSQTYVGHQICDLVCLWHSELQIKVGTEDSIFKDDFSYFSTKTYVVTLH